MAINKAKTSTGTKAVLIFLIVAFVTSFVSIGSGLLSGGTGGNQTPTSGTDPLASIDARHQPTVSSLTSQLQSDPNNYELLVQLGNTYFDWASELQQASQATTSTAGADGPVWVAAKDAYSRALAVRDDEPGVNIDYAIALFYSGETDRAIEVASSVAETTPDFAPAWFNLGIFSEAVGRSADALTAFKKAVELDPNGSQVNIGYAKERVTQLEAAN